MVDLYHYVIANNKFAYNTVYIVEMIHSIPTRWSITNHLVGIERIIYNV